MVHAFPDTGLSFLSNEELIKIGATNKHYNKQAMALLFSRSSEEAVYYQAKILEKIIQHNTQKKFEKPSLITREWLNNPKLTTADRINAIHYLAVQNNISLPSSQIDFQKLAPIDLVYLGMKNVVANLTQLQVNSILGQMLSGDEQDLGLAYSSSYYFLCALNTLLSAASSVSEVQRTKLYNFAKNQLNTLNLNVQEKELIYRIIIKLKLPQEELRALYNTVTSTVHNSNLFDNLPILEIFFPYIDSKQAKDTFEKVKNHFYKKNATDYIDVRKINRLRDTLIKLNSTHPQDNSNNIELINQFFAKATGDLHQENVELLKVFFLSFDFKEFVKMDISYLLEQFGYHSIIFPQALNCISGFLFSLNTQQVNIVYEYIVQSDNLLKEVDSIIALKKFMPYFSSQQNQTLAKKYINSLYSHYSLADLVEIAPIIEPYLDSNEREKIFQRIHDFKKVSTVSYLKALTAIAPFLTQDQVNKLINEEKLIERLGETPAPWGEGYRYPDESHQVMNLVSLLISLNKYDISQLKFSPEIEKECTVIVLKEIACWVKKIDAIKTTKGLPFFSKKEDSRPKTLNNEGRDLEQYKKESRLNLTVIQ